MEDIEYLTYAQVLEIHAEQLALFGGGAGIRDENRIKSAIGQPGMFVFGIEVHADIADKAAAYLFHLSECQGFIDGNKRTALMVAVVFLARNGYQIACGEEEIYELTMTIANKGADKQSAATWLRSRLIPNP